MKDKDLYAFSGSTVLVTGATGLIGRAIINKILNINRELKKPIHVIAHIRNVNKLISIWGEQLNPNMEYIVADIREPLNINKNIDYIIHGASITSSRQFVDYPVETIQTALRGTENILQLAKNKHVKKIIYLSSMEVYGAPQTDDLITEKDGMILDTSIVRNSYPESKRMCEAMCEAYFGQYNVPIVVLRLTQTFGPGFDYNDERIFAEFTRCIIEKKDIVLHTKGETKRSYLYTEDAVNAILIAALKGKNGEIYNVANKETYCSIYEMAKLVANLSKSNNISVKIDCDDISKYGYAPTLKMNLDTSKIESLGWKAEVNLEEMYKNVINNFFDKDFDIGG